ncbi:MAG: ATP-binding cassette domain-containing protein [Christensenellaceae bacterium]
MLQLKGITKEYVTGDQKVMALNGVTVNFRRREFVSILGASGCGKTTLLNIIGGLDRYTDGDIVIEGTSTKDFKDRDWDTYRNHSVGFVFQSYNLIPHQSVLKNVELALTLSGIKRDERRRRAKEALEKVGLGNQLNKKPNQMSGGQMQRVAIARAIVNDPEIILADEPTGALDTQTSIQIMNILKELSKDRLVIMVTHNPDLAKEYSTRIINLKDGVIEGDTMPYDGVETETEKKITNKGKKPSMSFWTALSLSFNNLATKKARTILTSFAGSIGIIGIALILSLSAGFNAYIDQVQKETLTSYPLEINKTSLGYDSIMTAMMTDSRNESDKYPEGEDITSFNFIDNMINNVASSSSRNDLPAFKKYLEENLDYSLVSGVQYTYDLNFTIYRNQTLLTGEGYNRIYPVKLPDVSSFSPELAASAQFQQLYYSFGSMMSMTSAWSEVIDNEKLINEQYDFLKGGYPKAPNEVLLIVDEYNQIDDMTLYMLGLMNDDDIRYIFNKVMLSKSEAKYENPYPGVENPKFDESKPYYGKYYKDMTDEELCEVTTLLTGYKRSAMKYTLDDLLNLEYKLVLDSQKYVERDSVTLEGVNTKTFSKMNDDELKNYIGNSAYTLKVSGIIRLKNGVTNGAVSGGICYTKDLTETLIAINNATPIVAEFNSEKDRAEQRKINSGAEDTNGLFVNIFAEVLPEERYLSQAEFETLGVKSTVEVDGVSYEVGENLSAIDLESPQSIRIYPLSFETKDEIVRFIDDYNKNVEPSQQIKYSDLVGVMMSSITIIINAITYVLIAFVSVSLIVSSIMIGIITYISVLERTKEIGVLRSIGASKRDVATVFNAETIIIGLCAGLMGVIVTIVLNIPISLIIMSLTGIGNVASLPWAGGIILTVISVLLTTIAGLFPSRLASKKDPVVALRTE